MNPKVRLVALSFLMLFVELALIRWLGENIVFLSYFTNFVLLGSFLGIGLGFLLSDRRSRFHWLPAALFAMVAFAVAFPVSVSRVGSDVIFFGALEVQGLPIWLMLPMVFVGAAFVMYLIAHEVAQVFKEFEPLEAYRLDILGSVLGILGFAALSWMRMRPVVWGAVAALFIVWLGRRVIDGRGRVLLGGIVVVLGVQSFIPGFQWSPYYRVEVFEYQNIQQVNVNGIPHQTYDEIERRAEREPVYEVPYTLATGDIGRVMIVGAGTGSDVAFALAAGAASVDAVEIDRTIYELGRDDHPNRPYQDPRVSVIIDDGRAFMERAEPGYDLVLFALPDSLTLVSGQSNLRLESFLFTQEAIDRATSLLSDDGVFVMYNYYREDWLLGRLGRTLLNSTGNNPCIYAPDGARGLAVLAASHVPITTCPGDLDFDLAAAPTPATDDYPFLYVQERGIPSFYLIGVASILITTILAMRFAGVRRRSMRSNLDLFFMGAAFLLLETKSVVQFSLWFGTTWAVNAMVFAGILLSVLGAIEVVRRFNMPKPLHLYLALAGAVAVSWAIPAGALLELPTLTRLVAAVALTFSPIFLANLVFAQRFNETSHSAEAFGVNLLGAMVGGILEYSALAVGYRSLAILVAVLYGLAYVVWARDSAQGEVAAEPAPAAVEVGLPA
jgi:hypothetical protein